MTTGEEVVGKAGWQAQVGIEPSEGGSEGPKHGEKRHGRWCEQGREEGIIVVGSSRVGREGKRVSNW